MTKGRVYEVTIDDVIESHYHDVTIDIWFTLLSIGRKNVEDTSQSVRSLQTSLLVVI